MLPVAGFQQRKGQAGCQPGREEEEGSEQERHQENQEEKGSEQERHQENQEEKGRAVIGRRGDDVAQ